MSSFRSRLVPALRPKKGAADLQSPGAPSFRRGVFSVGGGALINVFVLMIEAVIIARVLSIADLGVYAFFQASLTFLVIVVDFGFKTASTQFIASTPAYQQERIVNALTTLRLLVIGAVSLLVLLAAASASRLFNAPRLEDLLVFMPIVLLFASMDELQSSLLKGFRLYKHVAVANALRGMLRLMISSAVLLVLGWGLSGLIVSWVVSYGVSAAFQWRAVPVRRKLWFRWKQIKPILRFGVPLQLIRYLWFAFARIHTFLLAVLVGPVGVAFYEVATKLPQGLVRVSQAFDGVYHPTLVGHFARQEREKAAILIRRSLRLFNFVTVFLALGAVLFGRELIALLFGDKYVQAAPAFAVMVIAISLSSSSNLLGYALTAHGYPGKSLTVNSVRAITSLGFGVLLIPQIGFLGAAYATALAQLISAPLAWWYLHQAGLPAFLGIHLRQIVLLGACFAALILLPPPQITARLGLLVIFPVVAVAFSIVSKDDFALVLPEKLLQRAWPKPLVFGPLGGTQE